MANKRYFIQATNDKGLLIKKGFFEASTKTSALKLAKEEWKRSDLILTSQEVPKVGTILKSNN